MPPELKRRQERRVCPSRLTTKTVKGFRTCLRFFSDLSKLPILDFSGAEAIDPGAMVLMHHLMRYSRLQKLQGVLPDDDGVREEFLSSIKKRIASDTFTPTEKPNKYPLRYVKTKSVLPKQLTSWGKMLEKSAVVDRERSREFESTMAEVLVNSFQHGACDDGCILAGQSYDDLSECTLAAVDDGCGIPSSLARSGHHPGPRSDEEWVGFSLERGVTAQTQPWNHGLGLFILTDLVRRNGGSLLLVSGNGVATVKSGRVKVQPLDSPHYPRFPGTMLVLNVVAKRSKP